MAPPADDRDALAQFWTGIYDMTEERVASNPPDSPLEPRTTRVQINVRRVTLPWMGTHILYVEEFPFDRPFEARRRALLSIEPAPGTDGSLRVRQYTRSDGTGNPGTLASSDVESVSGCDIFLKREGTQFRGG
ncbi:MAG TPA: CpcT/CpeT family chromophore lyase, partial [Steroidobacteraceae bacterium]|nr:CpcT/CpeT family chromophore lyase [Steroidobacteraceae bacterium]